MMPDIPIKEGCFCLDGHGKDRGPMVPSGFINFPWRCGTTGFTYTEFGAFDNDGRKRDDDLVSIIDPPKAKKPKKWEKGWIVGGNFFPDSQSSSAKATAKWIGCGMHRAKVRKDPRE